MEFLISLLFLVASPNGFAYAFNEEDVAFYLGFINHDIPPPCPPNEIWSECKSSTDCSDCVGRRQCRPVSECERGCDCLPRYFRAEGPQGPCVPVYKCPKPECGANEVYRECGPVCERCGIVRCRLISCDHKCYCKGGHLRNAEGACVPEEECPKRKTCSHNEEWADSGPVDEYCVHEEGEEEGVGNKTQEVAGCYCKEGYKRNTFGSCVSSCSFVRCYGVAVYRKCIPKCNVTCHSEATCEEDDGSNCYPGCFCPPGHMMNELNKCIPQEECSTDVPEVKIIHGGGIMVVEEEESSDTRSTTKIDAGETTPMRDTGETATSAYVESSDMNGRFEDGPGKKMEDVGQTEPVTDKSRTDATTPSQQEDFANEDI